jgi:hypothetical protein
MQAEERGCGGISIRGGGSKAGSACMACDTVHEAATALIRCVQIEDA